LFFKENQRGYPFGWPLLPPSSSGEVLDNFDNTTTCYVTINLDFFILVFLKQIFTSFSTFSCLCFAFTCSCSQTTTSKEKLVSKRIRTYGCHSPFSSFAFTKRPSRRFNILFQLRSSSHPCDFGIVLFERSLGAREGHKFGCASTHCSLKNLYWQECVICDGSFRCPSTCNLAGLDKGHSGV